MRLVRSSHAERHFALLQWAFQISVLSMITVVPAVGQIDRAVLEGAVTDPAGAAVVGANVKILAVDTDITQEQPTNSSGYYRFPGLAVGRYTVTVTNAGFKTRVIEEVILQVGQTRTLDIRLEVGAIAERIEVRVDADPSERSSAEAATVIDTSQIANLPNNGRDWASFTLLAPFAQDDGGGDQRTIRFAGRARDDNNFQFDGVDAGGIQEQSQKSQTRLQISQDAIDEYRVSSALYDAEYGTQAGGQVDVVTKSGTNDFQGSVFGYLRNSIFDARNFNDFDINGNPAIPPFRFGQYGMSLGGPVVKNKLFFFVNYEGLRQYAAQTTQVFVPSPSIQQTTLATSPQMCSILQAFPHPRVPLGTAARGLFFQTGLSRIKPAKVCPIPICSRIRRQPRSTKTPGWFAWTTRSATRPAYMDALSGTSAW
jgi:carboxypeptidase family protein